MGRVNQGVLVLGLQGQIVVSAGGWPRLSQYCGTAFHECFTVVRSQRRVRGVARPRTCPEARKGNTDSESGWYRTGMIIGDHRDDFFDRTWLCGPCKLSGGSGEWESELLWCHLAMR